LGIETFPRFVENDQLQWMTTERRPQAEQLLHALRQRTDAQPVREDRFTAAECAPGRRANVGRQRRRAGKVRHARQPDRVSWSEAADADVADSRRQASDE